MNRPANPEPCLARSDREPFTPAAFPVVRSLGQVEWNSG